MRSFVGSGIGRVGQVAVRRSDRVGQVRVRAAYHDGVAGDRGAGHGRWTELVGELAVEQMGHSLVQLVDGDAQLGGE